MLTQRLKEKRVQECGGWRESERGREREKECMHAGEKVSEKALWLLLLYVFPPPGPALCKLGLARNAVCSA